MAVKVSDLTTESAPASTDILLIADPSTGLAKKITVSALKTYMDGLGGGGDTTAPTVVSATAVTASTITIVFSESVTVTTAGWSFKKNGVAWAITSVSGSGATWTFTMSTSGISSDTVLRSYDSTTGATVDTASNELVSFTDSAVTNSIPGSSYQAESDTFFAANTGLNTTQKDAIDALVISMKTIGWSKFKAVYPLVGGTAAAHKWNLVNPVDTDAGFRLTYTGTLTHDANGITPGGTTSDFADTKFIPNTHGTANSGSIGYYVRSISGDQQLMGGYTTTLDIWQLSTFSGGFYGQVGTQANPVTTPSPATRMVICSRTGATTSSNYRDGTSFQSPTDAYDGTSTASIFLFGRSNSGTNNSAGNVPCSFAFIGTGLTSGEVSTLSTAVNTYQTALGRNV